MATSTSDEAQALDPCAFLAVLGKRVVSACEPHVPTEAP